MSSEIATSFAGRVARALDRAHQHRQRLLVGGELPATSRLRRRRRPACPRRASARRRRDRSRRSSSSASSNDVAPSGITIRSWMSMRRPACAPPPKIWISGSGKRDRARRRPGSATAARRARPPRRARPRATRRPWRCRRGAPCSACRRARSARRRCRPGRARRGRRARARDGAATLRDRLRDVDAAEARAAVAQVDRFARAARRARRRDGAADRRRSRA